MLREKSLATQDKQYLKLGLLWTFCTMLNFLEQISIIYENKKGEGGGIKNSIKSEITTCHYNKSYIFFLFECMLVCAENLYSALMMF